MNPFNLKKLFGGTSNSQPDSPTSTAPVAHQDAKRVGETYKQWGTRICASVSGNTLVLVPFLHNVYNYIYKEQCQNEVLQANRRADIQAEMQILDNDIAHTTQQIQQSKDKIADNKDKVAQLKEDLITLEAKEKQANRNEKTKMIIGCCILLPLTCYLFLFYSSTFYSAFLAGAGAVGEVTDAMFNPKCFAITWQDSIPTFFFMLCFPVIFLGLGFLLHFFSKEKGVAKYFKIVGIILITAAFDSILAYKIGQTIHIYEYNNGSVSSSEYPVLAAVEDVNSWAVIFCGFIAYIIWGFVFDITKDGYDHLYSNEETRKGIESQINALEDANTTLANNIQQYQNQIAQLKNVKAEKNRQLNQNVFIDKNEIKTEMTNFYMGWIATMSIVQCSQTQQEQAQIAFQDTLDSLLK